ncbi:excalibur calcium-binding domain-containing protein [Pengzhenrongella sicca]|uniref:Excalibur calcium-binding domain-containing protein n=1 Tax=Pengzhenrongella sicca TaxID=2819238 RepID=A0A8A4ZE14_9MICO|nr:excalibur calcium-binding domain-containing protein [Pengzhenrongella sicca]QTE30230.1 excalibur calcium-binding domain-containing protein [Pengzhenrongella sicca]
MPRDDKGVLVRQFRRGMAVLVVAAIAFVTASSVASAAMGVDLNCSDFRYRQDAQDHLDAFAGDPDGLDRDGDGIACEWLPSRPVSQPPSSLAVVPVWRFWSPGFNNAHFFTTNAAESAHIRAGDPNWRYEGQAFAAYAPDGQGCDAATAVYRFYSVRFQSHFFTASQAEADNIRLNDSNWAYEGIAYCATTEKVVGSTAVYRFWSPGFGKHFFTASAAEAAHLRANDQNWNFERIAYYVVP